METERFSLGSIVMTKGVADSGLLVAPYIHRHHSGDWGDLDSHDKAENEFSIKHGFRIFSKYHTSVGDIYIITEADRSVTTVMLINEY